MNDYPFTSAFLLAVIARFGWTLAGRALDFIGIGDKVAEIHEHFGPGVSVHRSTESK